MKYIYTRIGSFAYETIASFTTQEKMHNLFRVVENSIEQCFAHLLPTLFNIVNNIAQDC